jgi:hypothetical protein
MNTYSAIREKIKKISKGNTNVAVFNAKIVSVEGETCTIDIDGLQLTDVRLRAVINGNENQLYVKPAKDSHVLCVDLSEGDLRDVAVIGWSEIESMHIKIEETTIDADKNGIVFNGGKLDGMVKVGELTTQLDRMSERINRIYTALQNSPTTAQDGGAGYKTAIVATLTGVATEDFGNIENTKVKQ